MGDFELQIRRSQTAMNVQVARLSLPAAAPPAAHNALYRNNGDGTFTDVIKGSGLDVQSIGMGAAAADYDGDGRSDLCLTAYGQLFLFRNETGADGRPRFRDVSQKSGVNDDGWSTSAAFFDYDRDGQLDLFVCRYAQYTPARDVYRSLDQRNKSYGWPKDYPSQTSLLFHNVGGGRFENVSAKAGISRRIEAGKPTDKPIEGAALGVAVCDPNGDGWPDLVVANDLRANFYFVNQKNGTFADEAAKNGLAIGPEGKPRGGMGIDVADVDHSGKSSVVVGHFNAEGLGFWQSAQAGFQEVAAPLGIRDSSFTSLTFGLLFADLNNDGWPDLVAANGHVDPTVHNYLILVHYHQRPLLYLNQTRVPGAAPKFVEAGEAAGLTRKLVARGSGQRRLQRRWQPRFALHHQRRTAASLFQSGHGQPRVARDVARQSTQHRRHRRARRGAHWNRVTAARRAFGFELPLTKRTAGDAGIGPRRAGGRTQSDVARRHSGQILRRASGPKHRDRTRSWHRGARTV